MAENLRQLGNIRSFRGEFDQAVSQLRNAAEIQEKTLGPESSALAATLNDLAVAYQNLEKATEAEQLYLRVLKIYDKAPPSDEGDVAEVLGDLAYLYYLQAKCAPAVGRPGQDLHRRGEDGRLRPVLLRAVSPHPEWERGRSR